MPTLGGRLKAAREKKGWTQTYVCKKLRIPNSTLSGYERDYRTPDPDLLAQLADLYEVSMDWLYGRTDNPNIKMNQNTSENDFADLKEVLNKKRAHWGGRELTEEERKLIQRIIQAAIEREESATYNE